MSDMQHRGQPPRKVPDPADIVTVGAFLLWSDPKDYSGGATGKEAYEAFCRIVGVDPKKMRSALDQQ